MIFESLTVSSMSVITRIGEDVIGTTTEMFLGTSVWNRYAGVGAGSGNSFAEMSSSCFMSDLSDSLCCAIGCLHNSCQGILKGFAKAPSGPVTRCSVYSGPSSRASRFESMSPETVGTAKMDIWIVRDDNTDDQNGRRRASRFVCCFCSGALTDDADVSQLGRGVG